jgi:hypothetical protein
VELERSPVGFDERPEGALVACLRCGHQAALLLGLGQLAKHVSTLLDGRRGQN